ncbi:hypothetical protein [Isoptericola variabilis]|uniref:hypothetical protein n=1 Tax=Puerhibacterium sp. TATVAM-FAB25 TaxID=3093699 RepID=UPI00085A38FB
MATYRVEALRTDGPDDVHSFRAGSDDDAAVVLAGERREGRLPPIDQYIVQVTDDDGGRRQLDTRYYA